MHKLEVGEKRLHKNTAAVTHSIVHRSMASYYVVVFTRMHTHNALRHTTHNTHRNTHARTEHVVLLYTRRTNTLDELSHSEAYTRTVWLVVIMLLRVNVML